MMRSCLPVYASVFEKDMAQFKYHMGTSKKYAIIRNFAAKKDGWNFSIHVSVLSDGWILALGSSHLSPGPNCSFLPFKFIVLLLSYNRRVLISM